MRRSPGWISLAAAAIELASIALVTRAMEWATGPRAIIAAPLKDEPPATPATPAVWPGEAFIAESAGDEASVYRLSDGAQTLLAAVYGDGRIRLADPSTHRFAGMLVNGHADVLELGANRWCEAYVSISPDDRVQIEMRGGPFDGRLFSTPENAS